MNKEMQEFIKEGVRRYGEAALIMVKFGETIEEKLKEVLDKRQSWRNFKPKDEAKAYKTSYWSKYPLLNAKIEGTMYNQNVILVIAINWYDSLNEYPFYSVWFEPRELSADYLSKQQFMETDNLEIANSELRFNPDPDNFNLERDFNMLLDVFIGDSER